MLHNNKATSTHPFREQLLFLWKQVFMVRNQGSKDSLCVRVCPQLCPALHSPVDCSPPSSSVHGISQARILEWAAISFRGSSRPRDQMLVYLHLLHCRWILYCWANRASCKAGWTSLSLFSQDCIFFFFFLATHKACGILVPLSGIKQPSAVKLHSPNHWPTREFLYCSFLHRTRSVIVLLLVKHEDISLEVTEW